MIKGLLATVGIMLWAGVAVAGVTYQRVENDVCGCDNRQVVPSLQGVDQTVCDVPGLAMTVKVSRLSIVRVCYGIYGNDQLNGGDGINAWVTGPDNRSVATGELVPAGVIYGSSKDFGAAAVNACEDIEADDNFDAKVQVAFYHTEIGGERWGCRAKKFGEPSWLTVVVTPEE